MKRILEVRNHNILQAAEGSLGLQVAAREVPDLILIDLGLPDMDGQTFISLVRNDPALADIPMVAVSAWPEETGRAMAQAYGCNDYIAKPIDTRTFAEQVEAYIPQP